jgi:hypothetical protein
MDSLSPKNTPSTSPKGIHPSQPKPEGLWGKATVGVKEFGQVHSTPTMPVKGRPLGLREASQGTTNPQVALAKRTDSQTQQADLCKKAQAAMMNPALPAEERVASTKLLFKLQPEGAPKLLKEALHEFIIDAPKPQKEHLEFFEALIEACLSQTLTKNLEEIYRTMYATSVFNSSNFFKLPLQIQERFIRFWGENLLHPTLDKPEYNYIRQSIRNFLGECSSHYPADHSIAILAKQLNKSSASFDVLKSLLESQDESQFKERFEKIEWTFPSLEECRRIFMFLTGCLTCPYEPSPTNAKRLLEAFNTKGIHTFSCKDPSSPKNLKAPCTGTVIMIFVSYYLFLRTALKRAAYLELVRPFIAEALKKNPSFILEKTTDLYCGAAIIRKCEDSNIPPAEWQESLDFILRPYWKPHEKFYLWGNLTPLKFTPNTNPLFQRINIGGGYTSTTQSWLQNFFQEKNLLDDLNANPAYAKIWNATKPSIRELIRSFDGNGLDPKSFVDTASRIQYGRATAIGIDLDRHFMSTSIMNDFCFINNYGGDFDLKEGKIGKNALRGTLILKLKDGKKPNVIWTKDQIQGIKSYFKQPQNFQPATNKIFENYDVVGAYDARGQTRGNCAAKHNFLHIFNALMATAYNMKGEADSILDEFKDTLPHEKDTHSQRWYHQAQSIQIRGQEVPFCNNDPLVQMASRCYRDVTLLMRIQSLLDVVNDPEGIQKLVQMTQPDDPESLVEEFRTNIRTTTEGLVRLFKKRLVNQSAANKGLKLHEVGLNTLHQKDGKPFALVPYILENLNPDSEFSSIVKEVLAEG